MRNKIYILLDRSGSMETMWKEALGGINGYVKAVKDADVMLAAFDTLGYEVVRNTTTENWKDVTVTDITPRGGTPLLDASARMMHNMLDSGAERAILVVVTDGEENSSSKFKAAEVKHLTSMLEQKNYEIVFLGANFNGIADVARMNFGFQDASRIMRTSGTATGINNAMGATASATCDYFSNGIKTNVFYTADDKRKATE